jgi:hypothetical protein
MTILYRYEDEVDEKGVHICERRYYVIGETPLCWYVVPEFCHEMYAGSKPGSYGHTALMKARKRVYQVQGRISHCYLDKKRALSSFMARKKWQLRHLALSQSRATLSLQRLKEIDFNDIPPGIIDCGHDEYTQELNWSEC